MTRKEIIAALHAIEQRIDRVVIVRIVIDEKGHELGRLSRGSFIQQGD